MWKIWLSIIIISLFTEKAQSMKNNLFDFNVDRLSPYPLHKVTIFISHTSIQQDSFIKIISNQIPTLTINSEEVEINNPNNSLDLQIFQKMKNSKLYVALHDSVDPDLCLNHLYKILNFIVYLSPRATRPKFLIVLFSKNLPSEDNLKDLLAYGWRIKFLDFSIIKVNTYASTSQSVIIHYNPFTEVYVNEEFDSTTTIFPNKLSNLWGYRFNVPYLHKPPYFIVTEETNRTPEKVEGVSYSLLKILSKKMNFSLEMQKVSNSITLNEMFVLFKQINAKMCIVPVVLSVLNDTDFLTGRIVIDQRFIMVVPVFRVSKVAKLNHIFVYSCCFIAILVCFAGAVHIFKFPPEHWKVIDIYRILVGVSLSRRPQKSAQRIVFFSLILVSMKYSGDIFAKLTGIKVIQIEKPFETFDDIINSKMTVFMSELFETEIYYRTDEISRNLKTKPQIYKTLGECLHNLRIHKNATCITNDIYGQFVLKKYSLVNGQVVNARNLMKLAKPQLYHDKTTVFYETASPFVNMIEIIFLKIFDSGLPISWDIKSIYEYPSDEEEDEERTKYLFLWEVLIIATVGHLISGGVFLAELIVNYYVNRRNPNATRE